MLLLCPLTPHWLSGHLQHSRASSCEASSIICTFSLCLAAFDVFYDHYLGSIRSGGVQVAGLHSSTAPRRQQEQGSPLLEKFCFVPYVEMDCLSSNAQLHTVLEHCKGKGSSVPL